MSEKKHAAHAQSVSVGRVVHFYDDAGTGPHAALVTEVYEKKTKGGHVEVVGLQVFYPRSSKFFGRDEHATPRDVEQQTDDDAKPGSFAMMWRWPPRV